MRSTYFSQLHGGVYILIIGRETLSSYSVNLMNLYLIEVFSDPRMPMQRPHSIDIWNPSGFQVIWTWMLTHDEIPLHRVFILERQAPKDSDALVHVVQAL